MRIAPVFLALSVAVSVAPAQAQSDADKSTGKAPAASRRAKDKSLDDELLEGLGDNRVEGLDDANDAKPAGKSSQSRAAGNELDDELLKGLGDGEDIELAGEKDPISKLSGRMREVERMIADADAGKQTQGKQRAIADEMEKLIRELQKQCQASKLGSSKRQKNSGRGKVGQPDSNEQPSNQASRESSDRLNEKKTEKPDAAAMAEMLKAAWGHLPEHLRPEMVQSTTLEFLPEYLMLIEDYFKALAKGERESRK
jgi:hypothetical protein